MLCFFTLFSKLYSLYPNIYYRAKIKKPDVPGKLPHIGLNGLIS